MSITSYSIYKCDQCGHEVEVQQGKGDAAMPRMTFWADMNGKDVHRASAMLCSQACARAWLTRQVDIAVPPVSSPQLIEPPSGYAKGAQ